MIRSVQYGLCLSRLVGRSRLGETDLRGANLWGANLSWADLWGAVLSESNLYGADLYCTDLVCAGLYGADLRGASKYGRESTPLVCALAKVGAPWECIGWEWCDRGWPKPREYDHWVGITKLYMLGIEDD